VAGPTVQAESLFQGRAVYDTTANPAPPANLMNGNNPRRIGDLVTIVVNERGQEQIVGTLVNNNVHTINDNGTGMINGAVRSIVGRVLGRNNQVTNRISDILEVPNFDGMRNANQINNRMAVVKQTQLTDRISCQVVEVLPNGYLVVQGHRRLLHSRETTDVVVSGIINPYFINGRGEVNSANVANMQFLKTGKGPVSRGSGDGIPNKIYNLFH